MALKYFSPDGSWLHPDAYHLGRVWVQDRILVPRRRIREVLTQSHCQCRAKPLGIAETYVLFAQKFISSHIKALVTEFVRACPDCQRAKPDRRAEQGSLQPLPLPPRK